MIVSTDDDLWIVACN